MTGTIQLRDPRQWTCPETQSMRGGSKGTVLGCWTTGKLKHISCYSILRLREIFVISYFFSKKIDVPKNSIYEKVIHC